MDIIIDMKQLGIQIIKILVPVLFTTSFFLNSKIWSYIIISIAVGGIYYVIAETCPRTLFILNMITRYHVHKGFVKCKTWFIQTKNFLISNDIKKVQLEEEEGYNSLAYFDPQNNKKYVFLFNNKLRSNDLIIFKDESDVDITDSIEPYLGPLQNFHGTRLTPRDFNHKKIKCFRDGEINLLKTFEENEPILFV